MNDKNILSDEERLRNAPIGVRVAGKLCTCKVKKRDKLFQGLVLILTYLAYVSYRIARKPSSVVKNVLNRNCTELDTPPYINVTTQPDWCHWEPFSGNAAETLLGSLDSSLLAGYAVGMFISGMLAERLPLRYFLFGGMFFGGTCSVLLGTAYSANIHSIYYFLILQCLNGMFQSTGWPTAVKCVSNWFGKKNRGLVFGVWSSHLFIGSILGKIIPGIFVEDNWGLSFMVPGFIMFGSATLCLLFLPTDPYQVCCTPPVQETQKDFPKTAQTTEAISVLKALRIPGVVEYSFASFCAKLVSYSFTYWLTRYIKLTTTHSAQNSAFLATLYDIGGIAGSAFAGIISDRLQSRSITCGSMQLLTAPTMLLYWYYGNVTLATSIIFLLVIGVLVNGPYTLILTTISADLGNHEKIKDSSEAMATVAGIINGCGSVGGAIGPFLAGLLTESDVHNVFWMLMTADLLGLLCLSRLIFKDSVMLFNKKNKPEEKKAPVPLRQLDSTVEFGKI